MRIAGRQKGSKVKPYTHVVVQPSAPKSRYTFSYHSSEAGAKAAQKKYEPLIGNPLRVVKQTGKSANTDMMESPEEKKYRLDDPIWDKRWLDISEATNINKMKKKTKAMQKEDIQEKNKGLWHNIRMRRASGKKMRKKGEKGAPSPENMASAQAASEDVPSTSTASIPNPAATAMGPNYVHDRRRRKDKFPVMLKRFRKYIEDHG